MPEQFGSVRRMAADDLELVLSWRNHPEVRRHMYTQHAISWEEHERWFGKASQDPRRHLLVFELGEVPAGFVNFNMMGNSAIAEWGFYLAPSAAAGTGQVLGRTALNHAFGSMKLHKVCGEALISNERSIRFHLRQGFLQEGVLRDQHFDGRYYHDVVRFGLLTSEWSFT